MPTYEADVVSERKAEEPSERVFVGKKVTPEFLSGLYVDHTDVQGRRLAEPYIGKWIKFTTVVRNVYPRKDAHNVAGHDGNALSFQSLWMGFASSQLDRVETLTIGETITVIGKIKAINKYDVELTFCEFAD